MFYDHTISFYERFLSYCSDDYVENSQRVSVELRVQDIAEDQTVQCEITSDDYDGRKDIFHLKR